MKSKGKGTLVPTKVPLPKRRKDGTYAAGYAGTSLISPRAKCISIMDHIIRKEAEELLGKAIEMAKEGDAGMMRLLLDRVWPIMKGRPVLMEGMEGKNATEIADLVLVGVSQGIISPEEGVDINTVVEQKLKFEELEKSNLLDEIEKKMESLENGE